MQSTCRCQGMEWHGRNRQVQSRQDQQIYMVTNLYMLLCARDKLHP